MTASTRLRRRPPKTIITTEEYGFYLNRVEVCVGGLTHYREQVKWPAVVKVEMIDLLSDRIL